MNNKQMQILTKKFQSIPQNIETIQFVFYMKKNQNTKKSNRKIVIDFEIIIKCKTKSFQCHIFSNNTWESLFLNVFSMLGLLDQLKTKILQYICIYLVHAIIDGRYYLNKCSISSYKHKPNV